MLIKSLYVFQWTLFVQIHFTQQKSQPQRCLYNLLLRKLAILYMTSSSVPSHIIWLICLRTNSFYPGNFVLLLIVSNKSRLSLIKILSYSKGKSCSLFFHGGNRSLLIQKIEQFAGCDICASAIFALVNMSLMGVFSAELLLCQLEKFVFIGFVFNNVFDLILCFSLHISSWFGFILSVLGQHAPSVS